MKTRVRSFQAAARTVFVVLVVVAFHASGSGQTQERLSPGKASGTLTINYGTTRRTVSLKYAYAAYYSKPPAGARNWRGRWAVTLSDKPLPDNPQERRDLHVPLLAAQGKIHVLILEILPNGSNDYFVGSRIYSDVSKSQEEYPYYLGSFYEEDEPMFKPRVFGKQMVAGTASASNINFELGKVLFGYDVTFNAKVISVYESSLVNIEDEKPGLAYLDFHKAVENENLGTVRKLIAAEHGKLFEGENRNEKLSRLKSLIRPYSKPLTSDVYAPGKTALLSVDQNPGGGKSGGSAQVRMVLENGQWKVDWFVLAGQSVDLISNIDSYKIEETKKEQ
jgi:hypothetical protein